VVQEDVRQERADHAALRGACDRSAQDALFEHPCLQPLVDHASDDAIPDPQVEEASQMPVVDAVEVFRDVSVDHPALAGLHDAVAQGAQGVMGRPLRPEAERAVQEVLLVDRLQQHHDRPLRHLVLERRNAQRPL
jgi:hypothetical protein